MSVQEISANAGKNPLISIVESRLGTMPEEVEGDLDAMMWLGKQAASVIDINEYDGKGLQGAFGKDVARWMVDFLKSLNDQQVNELPGHGRVEQITVALRDFLEADSSRKLRPAGYDKYKDLLPYFVKIVLAK